MLVMIMMGFELPKASRCYAIVSDPGPPGKMGILKVVFLFGKSVQSGKNRGQGLYSVRLGANQH